MFTTLARLPKGAPDRASSTSAWIALSEIQPAGETGKAATAARQAKHDKSVAANPATNGQSLPKDWDEIDINHLVLAKDDSQWGGWWEAIPVEKAGDRLKLRWREKYAANVPFDYAATVGLGADLPGRCVTANIGSLGSPTGPTRLARRPAAAGKCCGPFRKPTTFIVRDLSGQRFRYERENPGELIHIDIKKLGRIGSVGHRITGRQTGVVNRHLGIGWEYAGPVQRVPRHSAYSSRAAAEHD